MCVFRQAVVRYRYEQTELHAQKYNKKLACCLTVIHSFNVSLQILQEASFKVATVQPRSERGKLLTNQLEMFGSRMESQVVLTNSPERRTVFQQKSEQPSEKLKVSAAV